MRPGALFAVTGLIFLSLLSSVAAQSTGVILFPTTATPAPSTAPCPSPNGRLSLTDPAATSLPIVVGTYVCFTVGVSSISSFAGASIDTSKPVVVRIATPSGGSVGTYNFTWRLAKVSSTVRTIAFHTAVCTFSSSVRVCRDYALPFPATFSPSDIVEFDIRLNSGPGTFKLGIGGSGLEAPLVTPTVPDFGLFSVILPIATGFALLLFSGRLRKRLSQS